MFDAGDRLKNGQYKIIKELDPNISDRLNHAMLRGLVIDTEHRSTTIKEWLTMQQKNRNGLPWGYGLPWGLGIIGVFLIVISLVSVLKPRQITPNCIENGKLCTPNTTHWSWKTSQNNTPEMAGLIQLAELTLADTSKVSKKYPPQISIAKMTLDPNQPINDLSFEQQKTIQDQTRYPQSMILDSNYQGVDIDGNPAYFISYKFKDDQTMIQSLRYGIKTTDAVYLITFQAEEQDYPMIEADAETIIKSITFP